MSKSLAGIALGIAVLLGGLKGGQFLSYLNLRMTAAAQPVHAQTATPSSLTALEQSVYRKVNQYRQSHNLPPLKLDERIGQQARIHSEQMAKKLVPFSHKGFKLRVLAIASDIPYRSAAENVAYNQGYADPAAQAVQGWIKSDRHRQNMEGKYNLTGIGIAKNAAGEYYFTQIFILQR